MRKKKRLILDDGLDDILSQSLDMFKKKSLDDDAIDITGMFESGGQHGLFQTFQKKVYKRERVPTKKKVGAPFSNNLCHLFPGSLE